MEKRKMIMLAYILMIASGVFADKYKVLYLNSSGIKVGNKAIVVGNIFDDKDAIKWTSEQQAMKVINLNTNRMMVLAAKDLKKKNALSLYDYLTSIKRLSTRDFRKKRNIEGWQLDSTLYLMDTLYISMPKRLSHSVVAKVIIKQSNIKEIPLCDDGEYYILTRDIWENSTPESLKIDIKEYDPKLNWEYTIYRNLIIEPLPIMF